MEAKKRQVRNEFETDDRILEESENQLGCTEKPAVGDHWRTGNWRFKRKRGTQKYGVRPENKEGAWECSNTRRNKTRSKVGVQNGRQVKL